jgi:hypothetical protein
MIETIAMILVRDKEVKKVGVHSFSVSSQTTIGLFYICEFRRKFPDHHRACPGGVNVIIVMI